MGMMKKPDFYAAFAVILPVALGFGLIYLSLMRGLDPMTAVGSIIAIAVLILVVGFLANVASDEESGSQRKDSREDRD